MHHQSFIIDKTKNVALIFTVYYYIHKNLVGYTYFNINLLYHTLLRDRIILFTITHNSQ